MEGNPTYTHQIEVAQLEQSMGHTVPH